jgi:hypothetical protein
MKVFRSLLLAVLAMSALVTAANAQNGRQQKVYLDDGTGLFSIIQSATLGAGGQTVTIGNGGAGTSNYAPIVSTTGWAAGDIYYASSTPGVLTRLGTGSNGQILTLTSGIPAWSSTVATTTNFSSNLGLNTTTPNVALDVNGHIAFRTDSVYSTSSSINNLATQTSNVKITGATGDFTITGISGGAPGKRVRLYNTTGRFMTIAEQSTSSTAGNRIRTLAGGDIILGGRSAIEFVYDDSLGNWVANSSLAKTTTGVIASGTAYTLEPGNQDFSTSTVTDANLNFKAIAGATYEVRGTIVLSNATTANTFIAGFNTGDASSVVQVTMFAAANLTGSNNFQAAVLIAADGTSGMQTCALGNNLTNFVNFVGILKPAVSGTVSLIWKNAKGGNANGQVLQNSYMAFTRVQ